MGAYINPVAETKEEFLAKQGKKISKGEAIRHQDFKENLVVALVENNAFTAAAIAFDERELRDFTMPTERRKVEYFLVPKHKLLPVSNLEQYIK